MVETLEARMVNSDELRDLKAALDAFAAMLHGEYPDSYTLAQIADIWGGEYGVTHEQVEAIRRIESRESQGVA